MSELESQSNEQSVVQDQATVSFKDSLSEDIRNEAALQDFKDVSSLAKSYVHAQRMIGNSIRIPSEDSSEESRNEFYEKLGKVKGVMKAPNPDDPASLEPLLRQLGKPEDPSKYNFDIPEHLQPLIDNNLVENYKKLAFDTGMTQKQVELMAKFELKRLEEFNNHMSASRVNGEKVLKEQWGPDYGVRMAGAKSVLNHYKTQFPDAIKELVGSSAANNPALIKILSEYGGMLKEKGAIQGNGTPQYGMSALEARDKIQEILGNRNHAYYNDTDPNHNDAVTRMQKLYGIAYSE